MLPLKWESLSRCSTHVIHVYQKLPLALDCRQSKYSLYISNIYIFSILGVAFAALFPCYFQKLELLEIKTFWNFSCIVLLFVLAQKVSQIFKILFQSGDINKSVLRDVFFSRYVQLKRKSETHFIRNYQTLTWQSIKEKFHLRQKLELWKVIHNEAAHMFVWKEKQILFDQPFSL